MSETKMAVDVRLQNSPYNLPASSTLPLPAEGLTYSRHYAQKLHDMAKTSKESWISKLWNHIVSNKNKKGDRHSSLVAIKQGVVSQETSKTNTVTQLSPISGARNNPKSASQPVQTIPATRQNSHKPHEPKVTETKRTSATPPKNSIERSKTLPLELVDSPYLPPREKEKYKFTSDKSEKGKDAAKSVSKSKNASQSPIKRDGFHPMKKQNHPYLSTHQDHWRPVVTRKPPVIELERKAKQISEKALKANKVFTCEGPYPVDVFVRVHLRKRGWVEKFTCRVNSTPLKGNNSIKINCEEDEDFEAICEEQIPCPWEEEHGLYAITSRLVRHCPARFIWGGRAVNTLTLKSEVIVNHFTKARSFSSKVGLTQSLRELPWLNNCDAVSFFPRSYLLNEEERDDFVEDFRLTACMSLLKLVLKIYTEKKEKTPELKRENTKYEEVIGSDSKKSKSSLFNSDASEHNGASFGNVEKEGADQQTINNNTDQLGQGHLSIDQSNVSSIETDESNSSVVETGQANPSSAETGQLNTNSLETDQENSGASATDQFYPTEIRNSNLNLGDDDEPTVIVSGEDEEDADDKEPMINIPYPTFDIPADADVSQDSNCDQGDAELEPEPDPEPEPEPDTIKIGKGKNIVKKVMPQTRPTKKPSSSEVPAKAVDWALSALNLFLKSKSHDDIDGKERGLTSGQWDNLLKWFNQISELGAVVPITEGKLRECDETLHQMKKKWPQYDIDGERNIWIVKPGDKSKGIGIEFCSKADDITKYITNATTQGCYVAQKYLERPLLVHKCKFDIRQWFLVTDWNPLTVWFYKDSYLRICSQEYSYDTMHEAVHLSNVAIQQYYHNGIRSDKLPANNFWTSEEYKAYLSEIGEGEKWEDTVYPAMKNCVVNTLISTIDITENRKNAFELYGADFILSEDYNPYLLEINSSPGMAPSSMEKARLCAQVIDDVMKVVLDRRDDRNCDTGKFEMIYRHMQVSNPEYADPKLRLDGTKIKKLDLQKYSVLDQRNLKAEKKKTPKEDSDKGKEKCEEEAVKGGDSEPDREMKSPKAEGREKLKASSSTDVHKGSEGKEKHRKTDSGTPKGFNQKKPPSGPKKNTSKSPYLK